MRPMPAQRFWILLLLAAVFASGCGRFNGAVSFENQSTRLIDVGNARGFAHEPPCGILPPGARKNAVMASMPFPSAVEVHWTYDSPQGVVRQIITISLGHLRPPRWGGTELCFTFAPDYTWVASVRAR